MYFVYKCFACICVCVYVIYAYPLKAQNLILTTEPSLQYQERKINSIILSEAFFLLCSLTDL